jgi:Icc-related predicted phosphoesterase
MKILAAGDIHGAVSVYEWLVRVAAEQQVDMVVLAGDLSAGSWNEEEQRAEAQRLVSALRSFPVPTFYLMGNDDFFSFNYEDESVRPMHGRRLEFGEYNFVGYEYSTPFVGSIHEKPEEEIGKDLQLIEVLLDGRTVFVTHSPAYGVLDRAFSGERVGSRSLAALLKKRPVLAHIHGHVHDCFGREGNHFNVAAAGTRRAFSIELPSLSHTKLSTT